MILFLFLGLHFLRKQRKRIAIYRYSSPELLFKMNLEITEHDFVSLQNQLNK